MRAAPDLFGATASARAIERRWAVGVRARADRMAGDDQPAARCALASALVKVARLTPAVAPLAEPISTLIDGGDIASRVRSLLDEAPRRSRRRAGAPRGWTAAGAASRPLASPTRRCCAPRTCATEVLVHFLP